jgi:hypothetical protein
MADRPAGKRKIGDAGAGENRQCLRHQLAAQQPVHADRHRHAGRSQRRLVGGGDDLEIAGGPGGFDAPVERAQHLRVRADILETDMRQTQPGDGVHHVKTVRHRGVVPGEHENEVHQAGKIAPAAAPKWPRCSATISRKLPKIVVAAA